ncbi:Peptidase M15 [Geosporobacter subterraneus DSM 17957]|uniref:Murein endopeptidase K n=1 Tax=Geosporobacter subterraneus DSM 17957 TaxID=1121919 RepID=A0A1M6DNG0_9FIRM|nr:D-Ala-D-Ala carboxypeptidase family metallohydrolase [Geosporobacter subterraneus]SHI74741.1 Peptidase M15 [Geosporobacter subterraneus DSM 17957]
MNKIKISENFSLHEFECRDGSNLVKLDEELIDKLQKLRVLVGKPIIVNSGYRTPEYNAKIGGAPKSQHMEGKAADIRVTGVTPVQVAKLAKQVGFRGVGIYDTFTHVDVRATPTEWDYRTKK